MHLSRVDSDAAYGGGLGGGVEAAPDHDSLEVVKNAEHVCGDGGAACARVLPARALVELDGDQAVHGSAPGQGMAARSPKHDVGTRCLLGGAVRDLCVGE